MEKELRILIVEDVHADAELEMRELKRAGLRVAHRLVETEEAFRKALREFRPEIIISDFTMPHFDGMFALALASELAPDVPFIFASGTIGEEYAIRALKNGATDYVLKNNLVRLPAVVERALQDAEARVARRRAEQDQSRLAAIVENSNDAIMSRDLGRKVTFWNAAAERMFGYTATEVIGRDSSLIVPPDREAEAAVNRSRLMQGFPIPPYDSVRLAQDGRKIDVSVSQSPIKDASGRINGVSLVYRDITERKSHELKIARLSRIHAVLSGINSAIVRIRDRQELFQEACRIAVEAGRFPFVWLGVYDRDAMQVTPVASAGADDGFLDAMQARWSAQTMSPQGGGITARAISEKKAIIVNDVQKDPRISRKKEHTERNINSVAVLPLFVEGEAAGVLALHARETGFFDEEEMNLLSELASDIGFAMQTIGKQEKLDYLSYYDTLTGLPNRTLFLDRLSQQMRSRSGEPRMVALILLDIERLRNINETLGRQGGDELLRLVARRLEHCFNGPDYIARIGADSFGAVIRGVRDAMEIVHSIEGQILACFREPFLVNDKELRVAVKTGVAVFPTDGGDADTLFKNAEAALRKARDTGERFLFYTAEMNAQAAQSLSLETRLRKAVDAQQFVLHYQPKVELASGRVCGLEALIRWQDPESGLVAPGAFIPLLEETGLILEVGRWALAQALAQHREWTARGGTVPRIAVNVSAIQLQQKDYADTVIETVRRGGNVPEAIELEITESLLMKDVEASIHKLSILRGLGINIAMDDFGTGYSSLSYITRLPIHSVKIDRSFINEMASSPQDMAIVTTIIALARALNLRVVAEGVETEEQAQLLRLLKCDEMQGYLFSRPLPAMEVEAKYLATATA